MHSRLGAASDPIQPKPANMHVSAGLKIPCVHQPETPARQSAFAHFVKPTGINRASGMGSTTYLNLRRRPVECPRKHA